MKKILMISLLIFLLIDCAKNDYKDNIYYLTSMSHWTTIDFKTNYTIQVPVGFVGEGLGGFEGNTFYKYSLDNKIQLSAGYCNSLYCDDFGDPLKDSLPATIQITNNYSKRVTLNQIEYFQQNSGGQNSGTIGVFYYSKNDTANGRLYWKDNGTLKDALEVEFYKEKLETVFNIIPT
jgi:hypothetical protein